MSKSADILEQARALYRSAEGSYRDELLTVGRMLHEFIIAYLQEGDGLSRHKRWENGIYRRKALGIIANRLGIREKRVNEMVRSAMVAQLLSDNGELGSMGFDTIRRFSPFIRRGRGRDGNRLDRNKSSTASDYEKWIVSPEYKGDGIALFRKCVKEEIGQVECGRLIVEATGNTSNSNGYNTRVRMTKEREEALTALQGIAKVGTPRDVAGLIFEAIKDSADPKTIAACLQELASKPRPKKPSLYELAETGA